jgi:hypothetical protein
MHGSKHALPLIGVPVLASALWLSTAASHPSTNLPPPNCAAWAEDTVRAGKDRLELLVKYAEPIGQTLRANFPDSARIAVVSTARMPDGEPMAAKLLLNTTMAVAGNWELSLRGDTGECKGEVYVAAAP